MGSPTNSITLGTLSIQDASGNVIDPRPVNCTIKTPTIAVCRAFNKATVAASVKSTQSSILYDPLGALIKQTSLAPDDQKAALQAQCDAMQAQIDKLDDEAVTGLIDKVKTIINVPNSVDGGLDGLDWESADLAQLNQACDFFTASFRNSASK